MAAIHWLQLILCDSFKYTKYSNSKAVVDPRVVELELRVDELRYVVRAMVRLIETTTTPIFKVDIYGHIMQRFKN